MDVYRSGAYQAQTLDKAVSSVGLQIVPSAA